MKEQIYLVWDFGRGRGKEALAMLARCDLRKEAKQAIDVEIEDPDLEPDEATWTTGTQGSVKLPKDDPRIPRLLDELARAGVEPSKFHYRIYSPKDLDLEPWIVYHGGTTMVEAGRLKGQRWDFSNACAACGAGAVPAPPLIARCSRLPKCGFTQVVPDGLVIVSKALATAMTRARLTGFALEPIVASIGAKPDDRYRWLRITSHWPAPTPAPLCRMSSACSACGGQSLARPWDEPSEVHFARVPESACDVNIWQGAANLELRDLRVDSRPTGDSPIVIVSQRMYQILKTAGVRASEFEPAIVPKHTDEPRAKRAKGRG